MSEICQVESIYESADPLGEVLHSLHLDGTFCCRCEFTSPWGFYFPPLEGHLLFHLVTSGSCLLKVGRRRIQVKAGDFLLLPQGHGHRMLDRVGSPTPNLFDLERPQLSPRFEELIHGGGGEECRMICGAARFSDPVAKRVVSLLPGVISIETQNDPHGWLSSTVRFLSDEARHPKPGGETVVVRLSDVLVIQAIRAWFSQAPEARKGWLGALRDEKLGRALTTIHRHPFSPQTVAGLAKLAGMSRSAFSARFTELVGESVALYQRRCCMQAASQWLQDRKGTVAELAEKIGYNSEAAFSRAFKSMMGCSPGQWRRGNIEAT